jgi:hypothetical protein
MKTDNVAAFWNPAGWNPNTFLIVSIIGVALGLRVWGIWFGLPYLFHDDEGFEVIRALQLGSGEFDFERLGKGGFFYLLFVEYGFLFLALKIFGVVSSPADFALYFVRDPSAFYLIGRATAAVVAVINIYLVYRITLSSYSARAAIYAAAIFSVNILHAKLAHFIAVDIPMTCLATGALIFALKIAADGNERDYYWAALLTALATTTKLPAVLLFVPLMVAHTLNVRERTGSILQVFHSRIVWQAAGVFLVVYLVLTPGVIVNFSEFLAHFGEFDSSEQAASLDPASALPAGGMNRFAYYLDVMISSMTWPLFTICLAGVALGVWKREKTDLVLISFAVVFYLVMAISSDEHHFFPRYVLPVFPIMAILGGRVLHDFMSYLPGNKARVVVVMLFIGLSVLPISQIVEDNIEITRKDTRAIAKEWIDDNIAVGSKIVIEGSRTRPHNSTVPLKNSPENLRASIALYKTEEPGKAKYFELELKALGDSYFDLVLVDRKDIPDLGRYKESRAEYLILRPESYALSRLQGHWTHFVSDVQNDPDLELLRRFSPSKLDAPGPLIDIYRLKHD